MKKAAIILAMLLISLSIAFSQDKNDSLFINLVNNYRVANGLSTLQYDPTLDGACSIHANWMQQSDSVSHNGGPAKRLDAIDPGWEHKFYWNAVLENCAGNFMTDGRVFGITEVNEKAVRETFESWVKSPPHNHALLDPESTSIAFEIRGHFKKDNRGYVVVATMLMAKKLKPYVAYSN